MLVVIPIRTESLTRRVPHVNYFLIALNVLCFFVFDPRLGGRSLAGFKEQFLVFESVEPRLFQFFTYQFLHADEWHLLGNLLFLWVFGNGVNAKLGNFGYMCFYLAGGVFAAWGYATMSEAGFTLVGASGAIAAVTTAYLVLYPRSRVTVMVWIFLFIQFFEWPALLLIGLKIVVWDNIIAPRFGSGGNIAYMAHLSGYFFGFASAVVLLWIRAVPRDQFDILALWKRWNQRRQFASVMSDPAAASRAQYGSVGRVQTAQQWEKEEHKIDQVSEIRTEISDLLLQGDVAGAATSYEKMVAVDAAQCMSEREQLAIAREFYSSGRPPQAAAAFERFVQCYPNSIDLENIRLLLGIIYARDLREYENADKHLTESMERLRDEARRGQCLKWLSDVRAALGRPVPEG